MRVILSILILTIACGSRSRANEEVFSIRVDKEYARPTIRIWAPKDDNDEVPRDVLIRFLTAVSEERYDDAGKDCHFGWRKGDGLPDDWKSIEGEDFKNYCRRIRSRIDEVVISGSTIREKGSYCAIVCRFVDKQGNPSESRVYLIEDAGKWKIRETELRKIFRNMMKEPKGK